MRLYFNGLHTEAEIKTKWRELCKLHHPDLGGDLATMQAINTEYETSLRDCYRHTMTNEDAEARVDIDRQTAAKVAEIISLEGLIVELCGRWVWVTGETFKWKAQLKQAAFRWASKKSAWYWHREGDHPGKHRAWTLERIKAVHGSTRLQDEHAEKINREYLPNYA